MSEKHSAPYRSIQVQFRSFEISPYLPLGSARSVADFNMAHLGMTRAESIDAWDRVARRAHAEGLALNFGTTRVVSTVLAHQVVHFARGRHKQREAKEALYAGYFTHGSNVGCADELVAIAAGVGLDPGDVARALAGNEHLLDVRRDEEVARYRGIHSVPCIAVDNRYAIAGAQSQAAIERVLERAWSERAQL